MSLRVVHVLWSAGFGGIERLVLGLARWQQADGRVAPEVLFGRGGGGFAQEFQALPLPVHSLELSSGRDWRPSKLRQAAQRFEQCDVIHFHSFNPLVARAARAADARIVYTEHGNFGLGRRRRLSDWINDRLKRRFLNRDVDCVTFNSEFTRRLAEARYGLAAVARRVVYNGIAPPAPASNQALDPEIEERIAGRFVVGSVGRLVKVKRVDRLLEGYARLGRRGDSALLLVGDGPERETLQARARSLGIAESVVFAGYRHPVVTYQRRMDLCVCSSAGESFGLVAVEALTLGKPVIVFADGGGLVEIVESHEPDNVVADIDRLAQRLEHYFAAGTEAGAAERRHHARRYETGSMADRFYDVYGGGH